MRRAIAQVILNERLDEVAVVIVGGVALKAPNALKPEIRRTAMAPSPGPLIG